MWFLRLENTRWGKSIWIQQNTLKYSKNTTALLLPVNRVIRIHNDNTMWIELELKKPKEGDKLIYGMPHVNDDFCFKRIVIDVVALEKDGKWLGKVIEGRHNLAHGVSDHGNFWQPQFLLDENIYIVINSVRLLEEYTFDAEDANDRIVLPFRLGTTILFMEQKMENPSADSNTLTLPSTDGEGYILYTVPECHALYNSFQFFLMSPFFKSDLYYLNKKMKELNSILGCDIMVQGVERDSGGAPPSKYVLPVTAQPLSQIRRTVSKR